MKITTKVRYGLRALLQIAISYDGNPVPLSTIAESQEISRKYLEQLVTSLRKSDLIGSRKGVRGGYYLARSPEDISLWEVFCSLEGHTPLVECIHHPENCPRSDNCTTRDIWTLLDRKLHSFWEDFTLQDLVNHYYEIEQAKKTDSVSPATPSM